MTTTGLAEVAGLAERDAFKLAEIRARFPIGKTKLNDEVSSGRLKTFRIGRAVFVHRADYECWLAKYRGTDRAA
jgi:hypothetical protein